MAYIEKEPFSVPMYLLIPTYSTVQGVRKKTYPSTSTAELFYGTFKTYGGTEREVNGVFSVEDTAQVKTWYRDDIKSNCRIVLANNNAVYEVVGEPENVDMRNQYLFFKVTRVKGGA